MKRFSLNTVSAGLALAMMAGSLAVAQPVRHTMTRTHVVTTHRVVPMHRVERRHVVVTHHVVVRHDNH